MSAAAARIDATVARINRRAIPIMAPFTCPLITGKLADSNLGDVTWISTVFFR